MRTKDLIKRLEEILLDLPAEAMRQGSELDDLIEELKNPKFRARWKLYLAGLTVPQIKLREQSIKKHREVQIMADRFMQAQEKLLDALWRSKDWSRALSDADSAFIALNVRRGQLQ